MMNNPNQFPLMDSAPGAKTQFNGAEHLYFGGTGYFGLHNDTELLDAAKLALDQYGTHSATTRAGYGNSAQVQTLEREAAAYFGTEDAVYLATGYLSDMAGLQALAAYKQVDVIFIDEFAHYSNKDGAATLNKPMIVFRNADNDHLETLLKMHLKPEQKPLVVTDGIFSIEGLAAPIPEHLRLMEKYDGNIWVDDAHGLGILGPNGRGVYDHYHLNSPRLFFGGTFAKAFGGFGGIIPGNKEYINHLRQGATINSGSYFAPAVAASLAGLRKVNNHPEYRQQLRDNALYLKSKLKGLGLAVVDNDLPIVSWTQGSASNMQLIQQNMLKYKIAIQYCHYVGAGDEGILRAVVFSTHSKDHIDQLVKKLKSFI